MQRNIKQISESGLTFCQLIFGGGKGVMLQDRKGGFWGAQPIALRNAHTFYLFWSWHSGLSLPQFQTQFKVPVESAKNRTPKSGRKRGNGVVQPLFISIPLSLSNSLGKHRWITQN